MNVRAASAVGTLILLFASQTIAAAGIDTVLASSNSIYAQALDVTKLSLALDSPGQSFTLFVPTDQAIGQLSGAWGISQDYLIKEPHMAAVMLYGIVPGQRLTLADLKDGQVLQTAIPGWTLTVDLSQPSHPKIASFNATANIVGSGIEYSNGLVHIVDAVLMPPSMETSALLTNTIGYQTA